MIKTREELKEYMRCDKEQLGIKRRWPRPFSDEIWKYERMLRKYEFWTNQKGVLSCGVKFVYKCLFHQKCVKLGIFIAPNTCGKGLSIAHINCIQINHHAIIGENLRIQEGVTIGASGGKAPIIGDNVYCASGCKIIGDVKVADGCVIGANAVVVKSIDEQGITVAGVPAKKISNHNSDKFVYFYKHKENE